MSQPRVPAFGDIGKAGKELLQGDREGVFQYEKQAKVTTKTADGVEFALNSKFKDDKVDQEVSASYKADKVALKASVNPAGKVIATVTWTNPLPNLTVGVSGTIPDQKSGKLTADYSVPNLTLKTKTTLTANPVVEVAASTGIKGAILGVLGVYDSSTGNLSSWNTALGYTAADYQVAAWYGSDDVAKAALTHNLDRAQSVAAEVTKKIGAKGADPESPTSFALGYARRLAGGSLAKAKIGNDGVVSLLYSAEAPQGSGVKLTHSLEFDATNAGKPAKFGLLASLSA